MEYVVNALGVLLLVHLVVRAVNALGPSRSDDDDADAATHLDPRRADRRSK